MVQSFLPNEASATYNDQAEPDTVDFEILLLGYQRTGVVSGCDISEDPTTPDMTVDVASGVVRLLGNAITVSQSLNNTITTAHGSYLRIDLITINSSGSVVVTAGTAAAEPIAPAIPSSSVPLAFVFIPASDTAITDDQINDKRVFLKGWPISNWDTEVAADAPLGWLKLDEASGGTASDSGTANDDGTYVGTPTYQEPAPLNVGGYSIQLNGISQYITWDTIVPDVFDADFTVEMWFKINTLGAVMTPWCMTSSNGNTNRFTMQILSSTMGEINFYMLTTLGDTHPVLVKNVWYHMVVHMSVDENNCSVWINGALVGGSQATSYASASGDLFGIGLDWDTGNSEDDHFDGWVAQIVLYDSLLDPGRIMAHYLAGVFG
jgi:hypothetical protein